MARHLIIITTLFCLLSSCKNQDEHSDKIKLTSTGDTLEVIKYFQSDRKKEIIFYRDNKPFNNIGFNPDGDTLKFPSAFYCKEDKSVFIFIPIKFNICSYEILFAFDSIAATDQHYIAEFNQLTDNINAAVKNSKKSMDFEVSPVVIKYGIKTGVLKCKMDSGNSSFKYYPFDLLRKYDPLLDIWKNYR